MFVGTVFPGDTNQTLKDVQSRLYGDMLLLLYIRPRDRYLGACRLIQTDTEIATRLRSMEGFDHRTLQDIHDMIAAWYRFSQDDGGQLRLGETHATYQDRVASEWRTFFEREVGWLISDDEFARALLVAAVYGNTDRGYASEAQLREILKERYRAMKEPRTAAAIE